MSNDKYIEQKISKDIVQRSFDNTDKDELIKIIAFRDLIEESINIIFIHLTKENNSFDCWKDQVVNLRFDAKDFENKLSVLEITSDTKADTLRKKIPVVYVLKKIQETTISYFYNYNDLQIKFEFQFRKQKNNYFPVEVDIKFSNIPQDENERKKISSEIAFNITSEIVNKKNLPPILLNKVSSKFRQSGHYIDMKLKNDLINNNNLDEIITKPSIKKLDIKVSGIRLNPGEDRALTAILKLLHIKSDKTEGSKNYYLGNMPPKRGMYGDNATDYPVLKFKPSELYKEYKGDKNYSGAEAKYIKDLLHNLQEKHFLIVYRRHRKDSKGNLVVDRIEEYQPLIKVVTYYEGISLEEDAELEQGENLDITEKSGQIILVLNPIFIEQINTKFIEYPDDINKMTVIASGGARKVTKSNIKIREYLMRAKSAKKYITDINKNTLINLLELDGYLKEGKKSKIEKSILETLKFAENLGILLKYEYLTGAKGQQKIRFTINKDFCDYKEQNIQLRFDLDV